MKRYLPFIIPIGVVGIALLTWSLFFNKPVEVKIANMNEAVERFNQDDSFVLVIGESLCSSCIDYRTKTITQYIKENTQKDLVFLYTNQSFSNATDLQDFLNTYIGEDYEGLTTYYVKNGEVVDRSEGFLTLEELNAFIKKNK